MSEIRKTLHVHSFHGATGLDRTGEYLETRLSENFTAILQLHVEAHIRLIHTEAVHRIVVAHAQERCLNVYIDHVLPDLSHQTFDQRIHVFAVDERQLDVHLSEFWLTVSTQIFIAEATRQLIVTLHTSNHQPLLILLRRLRQRIESTRIHAARHQELTRTLRCTLK